MTNRLTASQIDEIASIVGDDIDVWRDGELPIGRVKVKASLVRGTIYFTVARPIKGHIGSGSWVAYTVNSATKAIREKSGFLRFD